MDGIREENWFAWYPVRARVRLSFHGRHIIYSRQQTHKWIWLDHVFLKKEDGRRRAFIDCRLPFSSDWWIDRAK